jgi:hypothetical protein
MAAITMNFGLCGLRVRYRFTARGGWLFFVAPCSHVFAAGLSAFCMRSLRLSRVLLPLAAACHVFLSSRSSACCVNRWLTSSRSSAVLSFHPGLLRFAVFCLCGLPVLIACVGCDGCVCLRLRAHFAVAASLRFDACCVLRGCVLRVLRLRG